MYAGSFNIFVKYVYIQKNIIYSYKMNGPSTNINDIVNDNNRLSNDNQIWLILLSIKLVAYISKNAADHDEEC